MFPVSGKIRRTGLLVKPVEWGDRKERGYFYDRFQLNGIGIDPPVVVIETIPAPYDELVANKITGP